MKKSKEDKLRNKFQTKQKISKYYGNWYYVTQNKDIEKIVKKMV